MLTHRHLLFLALADIESLPDDEVLTSRGAHVNAAAFRKAALGLC